MHARTANGAPHSSRTIFFVGERMDSSSVCCISDDGVGAKDRAVPFVGQPAEEPG